jgi:hypothetical protein
LLGGHRNDLWKRLCFSTWMLWHPA